MEHLQGYPGADEVRAQLRRMLGSAAFARSERLGRFLTFLVERRLAGHVDGAKEYSVGVEVFDRGEGFDPRLDSIVRVEATRLRARLERYYETEGKLDSIRLEAPRGGYAVQFQRQAGQRERAPAAAGWWRWVGGAVALGLTLAAGIGIGLEAGKVKQDQAHQAIR